jgi:hypothetical protein
MNKILLIFLFFSGLSSLFSQENAVVQDEGIILSSDNINLRFHKYYSTELDITVEKVFMNKISGKQIFYTGVPNSGEGIYWVINNGIKKIINNRNDRYFPKIFWHGEYIVEIFNSGNVSFYSVIYYNFLSDTIVEVLEPYCVDSKKYLAIGKFLERIILYDLLDGKILIDNDIYADIGIEYNTPFSFEIILEDNRMIINYTLNNNGIYKQGNVIYTFQRQQEY